MPNPAQPPLLQLIEAIQASAKYRHIDAGFIRAVGTAELEKRRNLKEALKATKNKLHQVGAAYQDNIPSYTRWLEALRAASLTGDPAQLQATCREIMQLHASTRERLPFLSHFYSAILAHIAPVHSVLDIACGLNPLAIPSMPLAPGARYYACDIYQDMADFLQACFPLLHVDGEATVCDVIQHCPTHKVDVAFVLKTIPVLEQVDKNAGRRLLQSIHADHLVVSFPAASLGGRSKGMATNYETHFNELVAGQNWSIQRFSYAAELVFVIHK
ncbi:MAG: 16S rRNA methyltransferase [Ktedonobacteraceae bacterium]